MKKILVTLFIFTFLLSPCFSQSWLWAREGRNAGLKENANMSIAEDNLHNVYEAGKMGGDTLILQTDTLFSTGGGVEALLAKYDENGNLLWARHSDRCINSFAQVSHVNTDRNNNVYVAGLFVDSIYFQPYSLKSASNSVYNVFLIKYNSNGDILWARQSKSASINSCSASVFGSATDNFGNTFITGLFQDTVVFSLDTITSNGNAAFFIAKYDSSGNLKWIKKAVNNSIYGLTNGYSVTTDKAGNVYATGAIVDTVTFSTQTLKSKFEDAFIVKYDSGGNLVWAKQTTTPSSSSDGIGGGICLDRDNNIYISGHFYDTLYIGASTLIDPDNLFDVFWAKYDNNGIPVWVKQAYPLENPPCQWTSWLITTDNAKNIYVRANMVPAQHPQQAKIVFGNDTLQLSKSYTGSAWVKFDSSGNNALAGYIFPTGGGWLEDPFVVDTSGCYVYFGGDASDTTIILSNDTIGENAKFSYPFVARWSLGNCTTGINTIESPNLTVNLYPNPNNGKFNIEVSSQWPYISENRVEVYNMLGEKIYSRSAQADDNLINLGTKSSGIYLYRIINQQGNLLASGKFIIQ